MPRRLRHIGKYRPPARAELTVTPPCCHGCDKVRIDNLTGRSIASGIRVAGAAGRGRAARPARLARPGDVPVRRSQGGVPAASEPRKLRPGRFRGQPGLVTVARGSEEVCGGLPRCRGRRSDSESEFEAWAPRLTEAPSRRGAGPTPPAPGRAGPRPRPRRPGHGHVQWHSVPVSHESPCL